MILMEKESKIDMNISELIFIVLWVMGVVVAKGAWTTFFAIVFPPWSFYVFFEYIFKLLGII